MSDAMRRREFMTPASVLSSTEQAALAECGKAGALLKQNGVWRGSSVGLAINGNTVANLAREGLLTVEKNGRLGSATLTDLGEKFARALLARADEVIE
jgi:hypothetical protein